MLRLPAIYYAGGSFCVNLLLRRLFLRKSFSDILFPGRAYDTSSDTITLPTLVNALCSESLAFFQGSS